MKVVYITYPWFLDFSIEYIKELSKSVDLYVYIITNENKLSGTILNINSDVLKESARTFKFSEMKNFIKEHHFFDEYTHYCRDVNVIIFPKKRIGFKGVFENRKLAHSINIINPDLIHFDDISLELFALPTFLRCKYWILNVHDPIPHSGEWNWRRNFIRLIFYSKANAFLTFSEFANAQFKNYFKIKVPVYQLTLVPYTFYLKYGVFSSKLYISNKYILFFGRLSKYKGIDDLILAFREINRRHPDLKLVIAGRSVPGFQISSSLQQTSNVLIIDKFLENNELADLISRSLFVVCPYRDATQSGVVMTSFAFKKKVIVSNVGGLPESIGEFNGIVYDQSRSEDLILSISKLLDAKVTDIDFGLKNMYNIKFNVNLLVKIYDKVCIPKKQKVRH